MVRKIVSDISVDVLDEDLKRYRDMALELGAVDAKVIPADAVVTDVRVRAKCAYPRYGNYDGRNANCPPYAMDLDQV